MFLLCGAKKDKLPFHERSPLVCDRARHVLDVPSPLVKYSQRVSSDPYHPDNNIGGYVDLGLAENKMCEDLTTDKLRSMDLSKEDESALQYYPNLKGLPSFRKTLAEFLQRRFRPTMKIDPEHLIVASGTTAILDTLAFSLAEPGEFLMVPAPYYYRIKNDVEDRAGVQVLEVPLSSKDGFALSVKQFELVFNRATEQGKKVRGILIINPNNPLGDVYTEKFLIELLHFAAIHGLHVISDEIYAESVFDKDTKFHSILSLPLPDPQRVHFIWGVSKDFGLSGYRCGLLHTQNPQVLQYFTAVGIFQTTPPLVQKRIEHILTYTHWLDYVYFPTLKKRLRTLHKAATNRLTAMGVHVHPSKAAIFIWADFSPFLSEHTFAAEQELFLKFMDAKVYSLPGKQSYCPSPGWFRIVFASNQNNVMEGLKRIEFVLMSLPSKKGVKVNGDVS